MTKIPPSVVRWSSAFARNRALNSTTARGVTKLFQRSHEKFTAKSSNIVIFSSNAGKSERWEEFIIPLFWSIFIWRWKWNLPLISGVSFVAGKATAEHTIFIKQAISPLNIRHKFCFVFCWNIRSIWRVAKFLVIDVNEVSTIEQFSPLVSEEGVHWKRPLRF